MGLTWIGFHLDSKLGATGLNPDKLEVLLQLLRTVRDAALISESVFKPIPHKLSWATMALESLKPLLQPLFAFSASFVKDRMAVPSLVKPTVDCFINILTHSPMYQSAEFRHSVARTGATDASGKKKARTCGIGGWFCHGTSSKARAYWFMYTFNPTTLEWAFDRDEDSFRRIAALELFATAVYIKMLISILGLGVRAQPTQRPYAARLTIPGITDNQGNSNLLARLYTKRWPGAAVLMEIAQDLVTHDLAIDVEFAPREDNTWSDALANGNAAGFDTTRRYNPDISAATYWNTLPEMLRCGALMGLHLKKRKSDAMVPLVDDLASMPPIAHQQWQ